MALPLLVGGVASASELQNSPATRCGIISGRVIDENEMPIPNATVYAMPVDDKPVSSRVDLLTSTSDATGQFTIRDVPVGTVYLDAAKDDAGYPHSIFSFYLMPHQKKPVLKIQCGETVEDATIKLGPKVAYLKLHIHDGAGRPIASGTMILSRPDMGEVGTLGTSFVADSRFPVPPIAFHLEVRVPGFQEWKYSAQISLKSGEVLLLDVALERDQDGTARSFDPEFGHALIPQNSITELISIQRSRDALDMATSIHPGMKRQALDSEFEPEGGISAFSHRTYTAKSYPI